MTRQTENDDEAEGGEADGRPNHKQTFQPYLKDASYAPPGLTAATLLLHHLDPPLLVEL